MSYRKPGHLYKTTIVIWSDYDTSGTELSELARDAESGDSICTRQHVECLSRSEFDNDSSFEQLCYEFFNIEEWDEDTPRNGSGFKAG